MKFVKKTRTLNIFKHFSVTLYKQNLLQLSQLSKDSV